MYNSLKKNMDDYAKKMFNLGNLYFFKDIKMNDYDNR